MAYENQCGSCANFEDFSSYSSSLKKYHCTWYGEYYYPSDTCVGSGDHYRYRGYITTMVCGRLGLDKDDEVYKTIIDFQQNVMENDEKYTRLLDRYNVVGPKISKELETEDMSVIQKIYDSFLTPVANLIKNEKSDEAIYRYRHMVEILKGHYKIKTEDVNKVKQPIVGDKIKVIAKKNI